MGQGQATLRPSLGRRYLNSYVSVCAVACTERQATHGVKLGRRSRENTVRLAFTDHTREGLPDTIEVTGRVRSSRWLV